jgi:hypothetical protein
MRRAEAGLYARALSRLLSACGVLAIALPSQMAQALPIPPPYTGEPEQVSSSSATLKGTVFPRAQGTSYYFQYGPTSAYGLQTPPNPTGEVSLLHVKAPVTGLAPGATYHCRLVAVSSAGTLFGQDRAFTTRPIPLTFSVMAVPSPAVFGAPFAVTGTLSGTASIARSVVLQADPYPYVSGFQDIVRPVVTDPRGAFSFAVAGLLRTTQLRVSTLDSPPSFSPIVMQLVAVRVALRAGTAGRRGFVRLYGTVAPGQRRALVRIQLLRPRRRPVIVASTVTTGGTGALSRFSRVVRVRHAGLYRAVVLVSGAQITGRSRTIRVG